MSVHTLALSVIYLLVISLCAPFAASRVEAAPAEQLASAAAPLAQASVQARRDGELLVRFRDDVDEGKRNEIVTGRGAKRGRNICSVNSQLSN